MKAEFELILKAEEARVGWALQAVMEGRHKINILKKEKVIFSEFTEHLE